MTEWLSTRPNSNVNLLEATSAISRQNLWQRSSAFPDSEAIGGAAKVFHSLPLIRQCCSNGVYSWFKEVYKTGPVEVEHLFFSCRYEWRLPQAQKGNDLQICIYLSIHRYKDIQHTDTFIIVYSVIISYIRIDIYVHMQYARIWNYRIWYNII